MEYFKPISAILLVIFFSCSVSSQDSQDCSMNKIRISCSFIKEFHHPYTNANRLTCSSYDDMLINSNIPGSSVSSVVHKNGSDVTDLEQIKVLQINSATVKFIPTGIKNKFINLEALQIYDSGLLSVDKENLRAFGSSLEFISFQKNKIISIDADLFEYNDNLKEINLRINPIRYIEPAFFTNLKNMKNIQKVHISSSIGCINREFSKRFDNDFSLFKWNNKTCTDLTARIETQHLISEALCVEAKITNLNSQIENLKNNPSIVVKVENLVSVIKNRMKSLEKTNEKFKQDNKNDLENMEEKIRKSAEENYEELKNENQRLNEKLEKLKKKTESIESKLDTLMSTLM